MLRPLFAAALCLTLVSCKGMIESYKRSNSGTSALEKKVLFDFRTTPPARVFATVLPASLPANCAAIDGAAGSFTYAAENEHFYLARCGDANRYFVFSTKLQASGETAFSRILQTLDLDHNDQNELLLMAQTAKDGVVDREASLDDFEKNVLRAVEDFGTVYHDPCARFAGPDAAKRRQLTASGGSPYIEAVVVYYLPRPGHQMPNFTAERYRAACPARAGAAPSGWERVGMR